jgi:glycosylphosphatidylinositol transamidase (GPIT) subunit GPI8
VTDRFTFLTLQFLGGIAADSKASLQDLLNGYTWDMMQSTMAFHVTPGITRPLSDIRVTEFFGSVASAHVLEQVYVAGMWRLLARQSSRL